MKMLLSGLYATLGEGLISASQISFLDSIHIRVIINKDYVFLKKKNPLLYDNIEMISPGCFNGRPDNLFFQRKVLKEELGKSRLNPGIFSL